jgi:heme/copper-type cytochrome/quinol oxidase subunit 1
MPRLSQWYVRLSFLYLLLGFTVGGLLLANKGVPFYPLLWLLLPAHIEFLLIGWIVQLTMGVAFWIAPRFWRAPRRGNERGAVVALWLLNMGILLVAGSTLLSRAAPGSEWSLALGRGLEVAAAAAFTIHLWQRIVGRNYQPK